MPARKAKPKLDNYLSADAVVNHINNKFGANTIVRASESARKTLTRISTGNVALDIVLGGGLVEGRVHQFRGNFSSTKTTQMHLTAKEFLIQYEHACYVLVDAENTSDEVFLRDILGFSEDLLSRVFVVTPDSGENACDIAVEVASVAEKVFIGIDSVDALTPTAEMEAEMEKAGVSPGARMMNKFIRKLIPVMKTDLMAPDPRCTLIMICQVREKIGVMFGDNSCFHGDAQVMLEDGSSEKISKLVKTDYRGKVLSHDPVTGKVVARKVIDGRPMGSAEQFYKVVAGKAGGNGRTQWIVTGNHVVFTTEGEKEVQDLNLDDKLLVLGTSRLDQTARDIIIGSAFLGDGCMQTPHRSETACLNYVTFVHGPSQDEYLIHKHFMLKHIANEIKRNTKGQLNFQTHRFSDFIELHRDIKSHGKRVVTEELLNNLTLRALAYWYMDDGTAGGWDKGNGKGQSSISCIKYSDHEREALADKISSLGVVRPSVVKPGRLQWSGTNMIKFHQAIAPFIPRCMRYKLHPNTLDIPYADKPAEYYTEKVLVPSPIISIGFAPKKSSMVMYDLTIEGTHSYMVDGGLVHNTTWGGKGKEFAAATIIKFSRTAWLREGTKKDGIVYGMRMQAELTKCKGAGHGEVTEYSYFKAAHDGHQPGEFDNVTSLIEWGVRLNIVKKAGRTYTFGKITESSLPGFAKKLGTNFMSRKKLLKAIMDTRESLYTRKK